MIRPRWTSHARLCGGCGREWYSSRYLSGEEEPHCPECDLPLFGALGFPSELLAAMLAPADTERPHLRRRAHLN